MMHLIDRRLNGRNKSAVNRERFIRRYKDHVRRAVKGMVADRSIKDMIQGGEVKVPAKDISEPGFHYGQGGDWESVHPGNKEFVRGDRIPRPDGGGGEAAAASPAVATRPTISSSPCRATNSSASSSKTSSCPT